MQNNSKFQKSRFVILSSDKKAFSLVELIVVITILIILWMIAILSFQNYTQSARDGQRMADMHSIKKSLWIFITEKWFYPDPDDGVNITYLWWVAWTQWTVWDNIITNLWKISKKPIDPLTNNEYTYSVTNTKREYQLWYILEGSLSYNNLPLLNQTFASSTKKAIARVVWTYNEKILKVSTGWIDYILAVPTIINSNLNDLDLLTLLNNKELVYNNYSNLPDSYKNNWYMMTGSFEFLPSNIIVYSGATNTPLEINNEKLIFINNLKEIISETIIRSEPVYKEIINVDIPWEQIALIDTYIQNNLWWLQWILSEPLVWWKALDLNCKLDDIMIWNQIWAGCNSTLWNWFERWKKDNWDDWIITECFGYGETSNDISKCPIWAANMASNTGAINFFKVRVIDGLNPNLDSEFDSIWWKFYTWENANGTACPNWRHLPTNNDLEILETTLNWWINLRNDTDLRFYDWLGWKSHNIKTNYNSVVQALKIPLSGRRIEDGAKFENRWGNARYWLNTASGSSNAYSFGFGRNKLNVGRQVFTKLHGYSVRCIKD